MIEIKCDHCQSILDPQHYIANIQITEQLPVVLRSQQLDSRNMQMRQRQLHWCKDCMDAAEKVVDELDN